MRKQALSIAVVVVLLSVLIPFASTNPDGLERVAETFGVEVCFQLWGGLMSDYSLEAIGNSYFSTLVAGILGVAMVFFASLVLGKTLSRKGKSISEKEV